MKDLFDLTGKVALVTGASRGIGESIARLLAQYGAHVIVSSRKIDGCEAVASSIRDAGGKATALACHVGEMEQITEAFDAIKRDFGKLDILVNNAAANPYFGHILDTTIIYPCQIPVWRLNIVPASLFFIHFYRHSQGSLRYQLRGMAWFFAKIRYRNFNHTHRLIL